jgi:hypothetical protein
MEHAKIAAAAAQRVHIKKMLEAMASIDEIATAIDFVSSKGEVSLWLGTPSEQVAGRYRNWFMDERFRAPSMPCPLITKPATEAGVMDTVRQKWELEIRAPLQAHGYHVDAALWPASVVISWYPSESTPTIEKKTIE